MTAGIGLSGHDHGRYVPYCTWPRRSPWRLRSYTGLSGPAACRTHEPPVLGSSCSRRPWWSGSRIRVPTMPWHRSPRICPQVKGPHSRVAWPFTKRLLCLWTAELSHSSDQAGAAELPHGRACPYRAVGADDVNIRSAARHGPPVRRSWSRTWPPGGSSCKYAVTGQVFIGRRVADHAVADVYSSLRESASHAIPAWSRWMRSCFERAPTKIE